MTFYWSDLAKHCTASQLREYKFEFNQLQKDYPNIVWNSSHFIGDIIDDLMEARETLEDWI